MHKPGLPPFEATMHTSSCHGSRNAVSPYCFSEKPTDTTSTICFVQGVPVDRIPAMCAKSVSPAHSLSSLPTCLQVHLSAQTHPIQCLHALITVRTSPARPHSAATRDALPTAPHSCMASPAGANTLKLWSPPPTSRLIARGAQATLSTPFLDTSGHDLTTAQSCRTDQMDSRG